MWKNRKWFHTTLLKSARLFECQSTVLIVTKKESKDRVQLSLADQICSGQ